MAYKLMIHSEFNPVFEREILVQPGISLAEFQESLLDICQMDDSENWIFSNSQKKYSLSEEHQNALSISIRMAFKDSENNILEHSFEPENSLKIEFIEENDAELDSYAQVLTARGALSETPEAQAVFIDIEEINQKLLENF